MTKLNYVSIRVPDSSLPRSLPRSRRGCSLRPSVPRCWSKGPGEQRAVAISHPPSILERRRNLTRPGRSPMSSFPILISTDLTHVNIYIYVCMYVYMYICIFNSCRLFNFRTYTMYKYIFERSTFQFPKMNYCYDFTMA